MASVLYALGEVQVLQAEESSEHWNVDPASLEEKPKLAEVELVVPDGPEVIVVAGGVVSTVAWIVQLQVAGV
jgi:hypothetical protein